MDTSSPAAPRLPGFPISGMIRPPPRRRHAEALGEGLGEVAAAGKAAGDGDVGAGPAALGDRLAGGAQAQFAQPGAGSGAQAIAEDPLQGAARAGTGAEDRLQVQALRRALAHQAQGLGEEGLIAVPEVGGPPHHQAAWRDAGDPGDGPASREMSVQEPGGDGGHAGEIVGHAGQGHGGTEDLGAVVIDPADGEVLGNAQAGVEDLLDQGRGQTIAGREDRRRTGVAAQRGDRLARRDDRGDTPATGLAEAGEDLGAEGPIADHLDPQAGEVLAGAAADAPSVAEDLGSTRGGMAEIDPRQTAGPQSAGRRR